MVFILMMIGQGVGNCSLFLFIFKKLNNKMKKIFKTWWKMKSFPEKHLIDEIDSVIKNENVPFFIHVIVSYFVFL